MNPYLYVYTVGGVIFLIGLMFAWRQGYVGLQGRPLKHLILCLITAGFFAGLQGFLQFAPMQELPAGTYDGGAEHVLHPKGGARGTMLDYAVIASYFIGILFIGTWFGRRQKTSKDFFFAGQRFSWWLITFSLIATTIGANSFQKYSSMGYQYGVSSSQTYLNDWIWVPLLAFGWLPILYFSRITSIPEYFGRRFNSTVRFWATVCVLLYLVGYIGTNLFTIGKVLEGLMGWPIFWSAAAVAAVSLTYVTAGGQTSVIMTDLFQGAMLLLTGGLILFLGMQYFGGAEEMWNSLPRDHRKAFPEFNEDPKFPAVGVFWQDGIGNTAMFYFLNQGIIMRFLAAKSVTEARKATFVMVLVLMTVAACAVGSGGWVAAALSNHGALPSIESGQVPPDEAFHVVAEFLSKPGLFGLILAAMTAALMSTVDTLITAVAAILVNDVYKPYVNPKATDRQIMVVARFGSLFIGIVGVLLVLVFMRFATVYSAHAAFTAAVTPPLVVALLLSLFWKRYTSAAALCTIVGGLGAIGVSLFFPQIITPFAHGVPMVEVGDGLLDGMKQYKFMRAFFGIAVSAFIGIVVTLLTSPDSKEKQNGLVWGTVSYALAKYKGKPGDEFAITSAIATLRKLAQEPQRTAEATLPVVHLSQAAANRLSAERGDLLYITDTRSWLGGLRSSHAILGQIEESEEAFASIGPEVFDAVVAKGRENASVRIEKHY